MGIYIKGLEMPKRMPIKAIIYPDGRVTVTLHSGKILERKAAPVPAHGRLIDERALHAAAHDVVLGNGALHRCIDDTIICELPTVIPAEEEKL